jgi:hypothetical protein
MNHSDVLLRRIEYTTNGADAREFVGATRHTARLCDAAGCRTTTVSVPSHDAAELLERLAVPASRAAPRTS